MRHGDRSTQVFVFSRTRGISHAPAMVLFSLVPVGFATNAMGGAGGPLAGLTARAVVVIDGSGKVVHSQLVPEIAQEPDYDAAIAALG